MITGGRAVVFYTNDHLSCSAGFDAQYPLSDISRVELVQETVLQFTKMKLSDFQEVTVVILG